MSKKQIEEMAQVIAQNWNKDCLDVPFPDIRMRESEVCIANVPSCRHCLIARSLIDAGYRKQEWISVDDRLPENETRCLVYNKRDTGGVCDVVIFVDGFYGEYYTVTHWMPLPEPPKMRKEHEGK